MSEAFQRQLEGNTTTASYAYFNPIKDIAHFLARLTGLSIDPLILTPQ